MKLTESLAEVGHVGEVARLLYAFARLRRSAIGKRELLELADRTAGTGYRYPNPHPALALAFLTGLVESHGPRVSLTPVGRLFVKEIAPGPLDLTPHQAKVLLGILLDDEDLTRGVVSVLRRFRRTPNGRIEARMQALSTEEHIAICVRLLQQLRVISYGGGGILVLNPDFEAILPPVWTVVAKIDEETLWKRLDAQRERGRVVEEFVLQQERDRLARSGRADLADLVFRVSAVNISAGYDIESFEEDGSPRHIEVKSSSGVRVQFEWSVTERQRAADLKKSYWIYFVPMAHLLPDSKCDILLMRNPVAFLDSGRLFETPVNFLVREQPRKTPARRGVELSFTGSMIVW